jgi:hypothetical protein
MIRLGSPQSPHKNSFVLNYNIFNKHGTLKKKKFIKSKKFSYKRNYSFQMGSVDLFFKDCFNFYNHVTIKELTSIILKKKKRKKTVFHYIKIKDYNFLHYLID